MDTIDDKMTRMCKLIFEMKALKEGDYTTERILGDYLYLEYGKMGFPFSSPVMDRSIRFLKKYGALDIFDKNPHSKEIYIEATSLGREFIGKENGLQNFLNEQTKKEKAQAEIENLDIQIKRLTVENTKFTRNIAFASLFVAALSTAVPIILWFIDKGSVKEPQLELPHTEKGIQIQGQVQQNSQDIQKILLYQDTLKKTLKTQKNESYKKINK